MKRPTGYSARLDTAWAIAAAAHHEQVRKGTGIPYIVHPAHVAGILDRYGWDEDVVIAGLLHDVLEDVKWHDRASRDRLRAVFEPLANAPDEADGFERAFREGVRGRFGAAVLSLVEQVSERKLSAGRKRPWLDRKREQLDVLREADGGVLALKAADILHNIVTIARDVREEGDAVFARFAATPAQMLWYYGAITGFARQRLGDDGLVAELEDALRDFERLLGEVADLEPVASDAQHTSRHDGL